MLELTGGGFRDALLPSDPMITESSDNESWQGDEPIFGGDLEMDAPPCTPQLPSDDEEIRCAQPLLGDSSEDDGEVRTPQPASDAERSDNGLPAPSVHVQLPLTPAASQEPEANITLPLDPCKCKARTWKRALLPHLPQCSRKPLPGHDFCQAHLTNSPYGRYDLSLIHI